MGTPGRANRGWSLRVRCGGRGGGAAPTCTWGGCSRGPRPAAPPAPPAEAHLLDRPQPRVGPAAAEAERSPPTRRLNALAGWFSTFNWGHKRHLSQCKSVNHRRLGPCLVGRGGVEEKAVEETAGAAGAPGTPEASPAARGGGSLALPCAASYLDSVQLSRGTQNLPSTAGRSLRAP